MMPPRALPPSGTRIRCRDIVTGLAAMFRGDAATEDFRMALCRYFGCRYAFFSSSGRASLSVLLSAIKRQYPDKDEVAIPAFTSFSVPAAVRNAGLKVSLYDLDAETLSPNLESLNTCLGHRTLCLVACHLFGYPCDMQAVLDAASQKGIPVIDDAAQSMGAKFKGRYVGTFGKAGLFSLSRGKNITAVDGGIIVTDDDALAEILQADHLPQPNLQDRLQVILSAMTLSVLFHPRLYWLPRCIPSLQLGASRFEPNFRKKAFLPFQAGIGGAMLRRLKAINEARMQTVKKITQKLSGMNAVKFFHPVEGGEPVFLRLPICLQGDDVEELSKMGVVRSYPQAINEIHALKSSLPPVTQNLIAEIMAKTVLTIPTHEFVTAEDMVTIQQHFLEPTAP